MLISFSTFLQVRTFLENNKTKDKKCISLQQDKTSSKANMNKRVSMGLSVWRETSKKLTVCREKGKKLTVCRDYFCSDNRVVCRGSQWG